MMLVFFNATYMFFAISTEESSQIINKYQLLQYGIELTMILKYILWLEEIMNKFTITNYLFKKKKEKKSHIFHIG